MTASLPKHATYTFPAPSVADPRGKWQPSLFVVRRPFARGTLLSGLRVEHRHREALGGLVDVAFDAAAAVARRNDFIRIARHHFGVRNDERLDIAIFVRVNDDVRERVTLACEAGGKRVLKAAVVAIEAVVEREAV